MKNKEKVSFYRLFQHFPDETAAEKFFAERRWGKNSKNRHCPHCGSIRTVTAKDKMPYRCKDCRKRFSVRTGTILAESRISLHKWLMAIYLLNTNLKGVSNCKLARDLGITQKTAWFLAHRTRKAFDDQKYSKFVSPVEVDETYMGGKYHNMHKSRKPSIVGAGAQDKVPVAGIRERGSRRVKAKVTEPVSGVMLRGMVRETVKEGAQAQYRRKGPGRYRIIKRPPPRGRLSRPSQCLSARQACIDTTRLPIPVGVSRSNSGR